MNMPTRRLPMWTRARLERVMKLRFGETARGGVDTAAVAAAMGVSRRTVQRWLHARSGRALPHLPAARKDELVALLRPSEQRLRHEADQVTYAVRAIEGLAARPDRARPEWSAKRWLEGHLVVVLEVQLTARTRVRQATSVRDDPDRVRAVTKRGRIVTQVEVPTNFHATVVINRVLQMVDPWRYQAQPKQAKQGWTATWTSDAPAVPLTTLWEQVRAELGADVPAGPVSPPSI